MIIKKKFIGVFISKNNITSCPLKMQKYEQRKIIIWWLKIAEPGHERGHRNIMQWPVYVILKMHSNIFNVMQIPAVQLLISSSLAKPQSLLAYQYYWLFMDLGSLPMLHPRSCLRYIYYKFTSCTFLHSCFNRRVIRPYMCLNMALILLGPTCMLLKFVAHFVNAQPSLSASLPDWDRCSSCSSWEVHRVSPTVYSSPWTQT